MEKIDLRKSLAVVEKILVQRWEEFRQARVEEAGLIESHDALKAAMDFQTQIDAAQKNIDESVKTRQQLEGEIVQRRNELAGLDAEVSELRIQRQALIEQRTEALERIAEAERREGEVTRRENAIAEFQSRLQG